MTSHERMRCLWIGREIPIPANTGDRIYSEQLAIALANQDIDLVFFGLSTSRSIATHPAESLRWYPVVGHMKPYRVAVFSTLPLIAAALGTRSTRKALADCLAQRWDAIVLDNYATAWALDAALDARRRDPRIVVVHVSHNFESALACSLVSAFRGSIARRLILITNYWKIRFWEKKLFSEADVISAITDEDSIQIKKLTRHNSTHLTLTPGYSGDRASNKRTLARSKRRVVLVGSFRWIVKQENLRQLLDIADLVFDKHGITLDVVGTVPDELIQSYQGRLRATVFHGFVANYAEIFEAGRIAIVPEIIGGGFKLKILDYIFGGLPVAALAQASAGLPLEIRDHFISANTLKELIDLIVVSIDDVDRLEQMQAQAAKAAAGLFDWPTRGKELRNAIFQKRMKRN